jgi:hypothetical protein
MTPVPGEKWASARESQIGPFLSPPYRNMFALMRNRWGSWVGLSAAFLIIGATTLIATGAQSDAAVTPNGCITAVSTGICPTGSPQISAAAPAPVLGASATGAVYSLGSPLAGLIGQPLSAPIIGVAALSDSAYWLAGADGGVFAFGALPFFGSMGGHPLNRPVVGIAADLAGGDSPAGYWLVASDGGVFSFGGAGFYGSMGGKPLNQPIVGITPTFDNKGYWLVAADGGVFAFGDAQFYGSRAGQPLDAPIVGIASTANSQGYWLASSDGGIFTYGDAPFYGAEVGTGHPVISISDYPPIACPPVIGLTCPDEYAVALANGQVYLNSP